MTQISDAALQHEQFLEESGKRYRARRPIRWMKKKLASLSTHTLLIVLSAIFLIPLFWMISTALKDRAQTWIFPPQWIPNPIIWENFPRVFEVGPFWGFIWNTLKIMFWNILGQVFSTVLVAYGFARLRFPGRNFLFMIMIATLMIPYQVTLIPTFLMFRAFGWYGTYLPLTVPAFFGSAFAIFLMRQYMMTIPLELDDAARIDGCNRFQVLWKIIMPLCKPPITLVIVFTFLGVWNDFLGPLIFLDDSSKYTLAIGLSLMQSRAGTDYNLLMAASLMAVLPVLIIYFFAQRHIIGGIASVGLKG